jgi:hypothetical protein
MTAATATYERTVIVPTYAYTAVLVTGAGETTTTLVARQDLDCPRRREIACPNCHGWMPLYWNINLQAYEPVHCTGCVIALHDIHFVAQPVVGTPEPVAVEETAQVQTVAQDDMLEPIWTPECGRPLTAADIACMSVEEYLALPAKYKQPWLSNNATEAEPGPVEEPAPLKPVSPEQKAYFVTWVRDDNQKAKYALLHRKSDGLAVNCSCPDRVHRGRKNGKCCKHMAAHNAMITPAKTESVAA